MCFFFFFNTLVKKNNVCCLKLFLFCNIEMIKNQKRKIRFKSKLKLFLSAKKKEENSVINL